MNHRSLGTGRLALVACALGCTVADAPPAGDDVVAAAALAVAVYEFGTLGGGGACMDVDGAQSADGTKIHQWQCNDTGAQRFRAEDLGGGLSRLVNVPTGKCVDVAGNGSVNGTQVHLWTCNSTGAQAFRIDPTVGGNVTIAHPSSGKCVDVHGAGAGNGSKIQIWQCNGTVAQRWRARVIAPDGPGDGLPAKVVAGYYPNWTESPVRIRDVPLVYNVIYLFAATPVGGPPGTTGAVEWDPPGDGRGAATHWVADLQHARAVQGRTIILSVGGAGAGMSFPNRGKSQQFVNSIASLYEQFGGFDGLDWNTFEADQAPDTAEMIWISLELKQRYPGFVVTAPPAPWSQRDKDFCVAMVQAGAIDYCAPQYYDGPGLDQQSYIVDNVGDWIELLGPSRVVVGFGVWNQTNYMTIGEAVATWKELEAAHPSVRGAFDWNIHLDESQGWPFASQLGPLVP